jgi:hypothetical protein
MRIEDRSEHGGTIESGEAQPVDGSTDRDERCRAAVADDGIVANRRLARRFNRRAKQPWVVSRVRAGCHIVARRGRRFLEPVGTCSVSRAGKRLPASLLALAATRISKMTLRGISRSTIEDASMKQFVSSTNLRVRFASRDPLKKKLPVGTFAVATQKPI